MFESHSSLVGERAVAFSRVATRCGPRAAAAAHVTYATSARSATGLAIAAGLMLPYVALLSLLAGDRLRSTWMARSRPALRVARGPRHKLTAQRGARPHPTHTLYFILYTSKMRDPILRGPTSHPSPLSRARTSPGEEVT